MGCFRPTATARALTIAAGVFAPCLASAADLLPPPPPPPPPPMEFAGGWYLRGDVGAGALDLRKTIAVDVSATPSPYKYDRVEDHVGDQVFVGGGVGYQFNAWLRGDVTAEYRTKADWRFGARDTTWDEKGKGYNITTGKFSSVVAMANGYVDLGTWYGVTPFIGGGVGVAHHMFSGVTDEGFGDYAGGIGYGREHDKTNFAWALHAGLGYDVTQNLKLELAYRYLNMGTAVSGVVTCIPGTCEEGLKTVYKAKDLTSHDVKIGFRYLLGGPVVAAAMPPLMPEPMPGPIVRKY
jgi:opacity protein-like surface antigen